MRGRHLLEYKKVLSMPNVNSGVDLTATGEVYKIISANKWAHGTVVDLMRLSSDKVRCEWKDNGNVRGKDGKREPKIVSEGKIGQFTHNLDKGNGNPVDTCQSVLNLSQFDVKSATGGRPVMSPSGALLEKEETTPSLGLVGTSNKLHWYTTVDEAIGVTEDALEANGAEQPASQYVGTGGYRHQPKWRTLTSINEGVNDASMDTNIAQTSAGGGRRRNDQHSVDSCTLKASSETPNHTTVCSSEITHTSKNTRYTPDFADFMLKNDPLVTPGSRISSIRSQIYNLPLPRLQVWLNSIDLNSIIRLLKRYLNGDADSDKVMKTLSIIDAKLDIDSKTACNAVSKIMKIQYKAIKKFKNVSILHEPLYRRSIQAIEMHAKWVKVDIFFEMVETMLRIWVFSISDGSIEKIMQMHNSEGSTLKELCMPLLDFIECKIFNASTDSIESIIRVISLLSNHLDRDVLGNIHDIAFSKIKELSTRFSRRQTVQLLTLMLSIDSNLERPFLSLCRSLLTPRGKRSVVVDGKELALILKCLSLSASVDFYTSNTVLGFIELNEDTPLPDEVLKSIAIFLLRTFGIKPLSKDSIQLMRGWEKVTGPIEDLKVGKSIDSDFRSNVIKMAMYLKKSGDAVVETLTNPSWIKENCIVPTLKLDYLKILMDPQSPRDI
ncbi:hypothetical protein BEWA_054360 [Theileria equi strain WA]|uniref:Uncharacterized protein n=1 Tax=Theileria equi strain WA TaxID=1537102 RepID=L1LDQ6_THEEQ|nr:hypothetical protein BEWA_054360 [Theileria equi strain WA]EKX73380.1 hypothetical protein BEWA_054360 [Theileria equi strain WA]|eukprot:XP_004832832.1 hypothetical protein BEWA_054360 [Theileria equi strain WA]